MAVATDEADVAYGSDTGGSVRIPAACCGTAGLKTTWGRIPLEGCGRLAPSFDTVGPMARDVAGLVRGHGAPRTGFRRGGARPGQGGAAAGGGDPSIDEAIDRALDAAELDVSDIELPRWDAATAAAGILLVTEAWETDHALVARRPGEIGADVVGRLRIGESIDARGLASARQVKEEWDACLDEVFRRVEVVVTPTLTVFPPPLEGGEELLMARCTLPVNLAGVPALALPVPTAGALPASLQLIGPSHGEEMLLAAGLMTEAAATTL